MFFLSFCRLVGIDSVKLCFSLLRKTSPTPSFLLSASNQYACSRRERRIQGYGLLCFRMHCVLTAKTAVLVHLQPVRRVFLVLLRVVVTLFAIVAAQYDFDSHITAPPCINSAFLSVSSTNNRASLTGQRLKHSSEICAFQATKINPCADR
jgi:hypothetical protein